MDRYMLFCLFNWKLLFFPLSKLLLSFSLILPSSHTIPTFLILWSGCCFVSCDLKMQLQSLQLQSLQISFILLNVSLGFILSIDSCYLLLWGDKRNIIADNNFLEGSQQSARNFSRDKREIRRLIIRWRRYRKSVQWKREAKIYIEKKKNTQENTVLKI